MRTFSDRLTDLMKRRNLRPHALDMILKDAGLRGRNFAQRATRERSHDDIAATFALIARTLETDCNYLIAGETGAQDVVRVEPEPPSVPVPGASLSDEQRTLLALAEVLGMREALSRLALATREPSRPQDELRPVEEVERTRPGHSGATNRHGA